MEIRGIQPASGYPLMMMMMIPHRDNGSSRVTASNCYAP